MGPEAAFPTMLVILLVIIIICRELSCWYFKINKRIVLMEKQNNLLEDIKYFMVNKEEKPTFWSEVKKESNEELDSKQTTLKDRL